MASTIKVLFAMKRGGAGCTFSNRRGGVGVSRCADQGTSRSCHRWDQGGGRLNGYGVNGGSSRRLDRLIALHATEQPSVASLAGCRAVLDGWSGADRMAPPVSWGQISSGTARPARNESIAAEFRIKGWQRESGQVARGGKQSRFYFPDFPAGFSGFFRGKGGFEIKTGKQA